MSVRSVPLTDRMICVVDVKTDFLNIRIAVHYRNNSLHELENTVIYVKDLFDGGCAAAQLKNELKIRLFGLKLRWSAAVDKVSFAAKVLAL